MLSKMLGGILLIVGTTIGGGMLALPIVTAQAGFWGATLLLIAGWMIMTFSAFLLLEVNMWMPMNSNIILMAKNVLGGWAAIVAWVCYLLLFYCLLAAYISAGSDILHGLLIAGGFNTSLSIGSVLFTLLLGLIVFKGIKTIDYTNRALMFIKLLAFGLLVLCIMPHMDLTRYTIGQIKYLAPALTVIITSYGFSTLIPSLRTYFHNDIHKLRKVILIGSLIPLICYIAWVAVTTLTRVFTSICVVTSFLGVSLCVVDFLADGFRLEKIGMQNIFLHILTFAPPLVIALLYPTAFIVGLSYAGICIAILIILFPALMVWNGRYRKKIAVGYRVMGGKLSLIITISVACGIILQGLLWHG
jgi:tyrosine-specific transport protein